MPMTFNLEGNLTNLGIYVNILYDFKAATCFAQTVLVTTHKSINWQTKLQKFFFHVKECFLGFVLHIFQETCLSYISFIWT